jgi:hypothetical protein
MERTLANLKNLPKLQLPANNTKAIDLPKIEAVPQLPRLTIPSLGTYKAQQRIAYAKQQAELDAQRDASYKSLTGISDPNDPYSMNSLSDALFNRKAKEKRYGEFAEVLHEIPILGDLVTGVVGIVDHVLVKPTANLVTGNFEAFGINALTSLSHQAILPTTPKPLNICFICVAVPAFIDTRAIGNVLSDDICASE